MHKNILFLIFSLFSAECLVAEISLPEPDSQEFFAKIDLTRALADTQNEDRLASQQTVVQLLKTRKATGCNLNGIKLIDHDLSFVSLVGSKIKDSSLLRANLTGSDLTNAELVNTDFFGSILIGTKFKDANLAGAQNLHAGIYKKCARSPLSWLPYWEYNKESLDLKQIAKRLSYGYVVCQTKYSEQEIEQLNKFK